MNPTPPAPTTLGALRASGYTPRSVREELRDNLLDRLRGGKHVFDGILGYDETVVPAVENALLCGHDLIFLGERGQAKTRMIRQFTSLLDEWLPVVDGAEIFDDPMDPITAFGRERVAERGDDCEVAWVHRDERYVEKLATPDVSIADLIGDVDPVKVAAGRSLADEHTIHFGLLPRTHRGIFCINELPDLTEKVQVGLFNVMEERDVQVKGYRVRLPLDVFVVASANPEDYTSRGRIITPLKDRYKAQIRTHYPTNYETLAANAVRRALRSGESEAVPRISDLDALQSSTSGKIELEYAGGERSEAEIVRDLVRRATKVVFDEHCSVDALAAVVEAFDHGWNVEVSAAMPSPEVLAGLEQLEGLRDAAEGLAGGSSPARLAAALEFLLEGLHLSNRLNKTQRERAARYGPA
jgi:magnesium chelatase subunit I